jgi:hypothetical protein
MRLPDCFPKWKQKWKRGKRKAGVLFPVFENPVSSVFPLFPYEETKKRLSFPGSFPFVSRFHTIGGKRETRPKKRGLSHA